MPSIRTANTRRAKALKRGVRIEAASFHEKRTIRLAASGGLSKLSRSSYAIRQSRRSRAISWLNSLSQGNDGTIGASRPLKPETVQRVARGVARFIV